MPSVVPLPIWPHIMTPERDALLRRAKAEVGVPFMIQPAPAVPGSPGRVLAFGEVPPFFSEIVLIRAENVDKYESVLGAMRFWLTTPDEEPSPITHEAWLSAAMGVPVAYLYDEEMV